MLRLSCTLQKSTHVTSYQRSVCPRLQGCSYPTTFLFDKARNSQRAEFSDGDSIEMTRSPK